MVGVTVQSLIGGGTSVKAVEYCKDLTDGKISGRKWHKDGLIWEQQFVFVETEESG